MVDKNIVNRVVKFTEGIVNGNNFTKTEARGRYPIY